MAKYIIAIIIIGVIGGGLWYSGALKTFGLMASTATTTPAVATTTPQQAVAQPENGMSATNDASDTALAQDTAAIDAQMSGLNSDSADMDTSLNDKSTQ